MNFFRGQFMPRGESCLHVLIDKRIHFDVLGRVRPYNGRINASLLFSTNFLRFDRLHNSAQIRSAVGLALLAFWACLCSYYGSSCAISRNGSSQLLLVTGHL